MLNFTSFLLAPFSKLCIDRGVWQSLIPLGALRKFRKICLTCDGDICWFNWPKITLQGLFIDSSNFIQFPVGLAHVAWETKNSTESILIGRFPWSVLKSWKMDVSITDVSSKLFNWPRSVNRFVWKDIPKPVWIYSPWILFGEPPNDNTPFWHLLTTSEEWLVGEPLQECQLIQIVVCVLHLLFASMSIIVWYLAIFGLQVNRPKTR